MFEILSLHYVLEDNMKKVATFIVLFTMLLTLSVPTYAAAASYTTPAVGEENIDEFAEMVEKLIDEGVVVPQNLTWWCTIFGCQYDEEDVHTGIGAACNYSTDPTGASCYIYTVRRANCKWCGDQILYEAGERQYGACKFLENHN